jgi:hypothetical protein
VRGRVGAILLLVLAFVLYGAMMGSISDAPQTDAAGRGLAMAFGAVFGAVLWLVLAALVLTGLRRGGRPVWVKLAALAVVPLSAVAASIAADLYLARHEWALWIVAALPPLLALYALWPSAGAPLVGAVLLLSLLPIGLSMRASLPDPARDAARATEAKAQQEQLAREARDAREREAAQFDALGPDSSIADYLAYIHSGTDAVALLEKKPLAELAELWQFGVVPTREVCEAYGNALIAAANRVTKARSDYLSAAIDLEWQLPNLKWLVTARCDLSGPLERAEANVRAVADSARLTNFADTLADIRKAQR